MFGVMQGEKESGCDGEGSGKRRDEILRMDGGRGGKLVDELKLFESEVILWFASRSPNL